MKYLALLAVLLLAGCGRADPFQSCAQAAEAGAPLPLVAGDPGWNPKLDPDNDGRAC
jgi:hypothetical protein